ncbi:MAG: ThiF family adenylyltransferase, partial [Fimbriimonadales bacterium]|nr:ThiF family adenylyltransferase [Fimbriimonadales bacterium]
MTRIPTGLVATQPALQEAMRRLERNPNAPVDCAVGVARAGEDLTLLWGLARPPAPNLPFVRVTTHAPADALRDEPHAPAAVVSLPRRGGRACAFAVASSGDLLPLGVQLIAPRLPRLPVSPAPTLVRPSDDRFAPLAGVLGELTVQQLGELHLALVGAGRTGSLLANALVRQGVGALTLIDHDTLVLRNLDGDVYTEKDARDGKPKAVALAERLHAVNTRTVLIPVVASVSSLAALEAIKPCDVLICAADNDGARALCGLYSVAYLKPLLDVGVGVLLDGAAGADVRWIVPGDRCLQCFGGIVNPEHLRPMQRGLFAEREFAAQRDWRRERLGSWRRVQEIAVGLALSR